MLNSTRLCSVLEAKLSVLLKPDSHSTSQYLITVEQKLLQNQCIILQLWNCTKQIGGGRIWVKMQAQSKMVLRFPCTAFMNMSFYLFTVLVYSFHSLFKSCECVQIGSKYSRNVSFIQRSNEGMSRKREKSFIYFIRGNTDYCAQYEL